MARSEPYFVGIDLAWSSRNKTGIAIIDGEEVIRYGVVSSDDEILHEILGTIGSAPAIIGIDSPLIVPNMEGSRPGEQALNRRFRRYHAGAHPANRRRLGSWTGALRGEELARRLHAEGGFVQRFLDSPKEQGTFRCLEIFPHPAIVSLFGLERIIPYKAKPKRDYAFRHAAFRDYISHLSSLKTATPPLCLPSQILKQDPGELIGKKLKEFEDCLDAIMSAYIVRFYWFRPGDCAIFGDLETGYIITPVTPANPY